MEPMHDAALRADAPEGEIGLVAPQRVIFPDGITLANGAATRAR
jgi:hypothetical protein